MRDDKKQSLERLLHVSHQSNKSQFYVPRLPPPTPDMNATILYKYHKFNNCSWEGKWIDVGNVMYEGEGMVNGRATTIKQVSFQEKYVSTMEQLQGKKTSDI